MHRRGSLWMACVAATMTVAACATSHPTGLWLRIHPVPAASPLVLAMPGKQYSGHAVRPDCPPVGQASQIVGLPMKSVGGMLTTAGGPQHFCDYVPAAATATGGGYTTTSSYAVSLGNTGGTYDTVAALRKAQDANCAPNPACAVNDLPDLGAGVFESHQLITAGGVSQMNCFIILTDLDGHPLEVVAMARTGGDFTFSGDMSAQTVCGWALRMAVAVM